MCDQFDSPLSLLLQKISDSLEQLLMTLREKVILDAHCLVSAEAVDVEHLVVIKCKNRRPWPGMHSFCKFSKSSVIR